MKNAVRRFYIRARKLFDILFKKKGISFKLQTIIFAIIIGNCFPLLSQTPTSTIRFKQLTIADGLSNSYITTIIEDQRGFIWIGTSDGLNRYDGYKFVSYRNNPFDNKSIGGNNIRRLYEDKAGNIWIGIQEGGLCKFNPIDETFTTYKHSPGNPNSISGNDISDICEDKNGMLWITVDRGGLSCFDPQTETFIHYSSIPGDRNSLLSDALISASMDKDGFIWITSWGGALSKFNPETKTFTHYMDDENQPDHRLCKHLLCMNIEENGDFWVGSFHGGLYKFHPGAGEWEQISLTPKQGHGVNNQTIQDICKDKDGNLWIATFGGGINILNAQTKLFTYILAEDNNPNGLLTNYVNCIYKDSSGSMWVGTTKGLHFYNPILSRFNIYRKNPQSINSISDSYIQALLKDARGDIWVGTMNGLDKIERKTNKVKNIERSNIQSQHFFYNKQALLEDREGNIWIGTRSDVFTKYIPSLDRFENIKIESPWKDKLPFYGVYCFFEDYDGSIWIGGEIGTLNYNPKTNVFTPLFQCNTAIIYPENKTHVIYRDKSGELWIGTEGGLKKYSQNLQVMKTYSNNPTYTNSINNNFITSIHEDKENTIWIGTYGGLHKFDKDNDSFLLIRRPGELMGDPIMGIMEDDQGHLWLTTNRGLLKYNPHNGDFRMYDESDGLQGYEFNRRSFYKGKDGEMLVGGTNGFNSFYPEQLEENTTPPRVFIEDFQIFNKSIHPGVNSVLSENISDTKKITLEHWQSVISFQFTALNYISPQKNQFAYKLDGFDQDWIYSSANRRFITYTNLEPGDYIFKVKASNNDGIWNEEGTELKIKVLTPLWKTWWAYIIYFLIASGLLYFLILYFLHKERYRNEINLAKLEAKQIHETDQLKLNIFTNISHELRTPITLILGPLEQIMSKRNDTQTSQLLTLIQRNAQRLLRLINQLLDFRKYEAGNLTLEATTQDIVSFAREVMETFKFYSDQRSITYNFHSSIEELIMDFDRDKLDKIIHNLLSNAFNYTSEGGKIDVLIEQTCDNNENHVSICVCDNGIGIPSDSLEKLFTLFYQVGGKRSQYGSSGIGLALTKELVLLHKGKIVVESEVNKGSMFTVLLPLIRTDINEEEINLSSQSLLSIPANPNFVISESNKPIDNNTELILVVEDNDDMRAYIQAILSQYYKIIEAKNGIEGLALATELIPDIIISDVMMPEMDGIELLGKIKSDDRTNHIPVILLTARKEEEHVIEGLEIGADDYITKPFNNSILRARIKNMLQSRKKMWDVFEKSKNISETTPDNNYISRNEPFIEKMTDIVVKNMANPEFDLEAFASQLKMSSGQLTRKSKAIMNMTPYNFIINIRMTKAAEMMKSSDKNITEIAFETGYQELSNFSRAFTKFFGKSPSQYLKDLKE